MTVQSGELRLERREVRGLGIERGLGGVGRLLGRDHLLLGLGLESVALSARDDGLVAEALCGVARSDRVRVHVGVQLDELVVLDMNSRDEGGLERCRGRGALTRHVCARAWLA